MRYKYCLLVRECCSTVSILVCMLYGESYALLMNCTLMPSLKLHDPVSNYMLNKNHSHEQQISHLDRNCDHAVELVQPLACDHILPVFQQLASHANSVPTDMHKHQHFTRSACGVGLTILRV